MWSIHFLVLLLANVGLIASQKYCHVQGKPQRSNNTFECECDWEGIWLDIVLLLPQASGTELDLSNIKASVDTLLGFMNISESDRNSHFSVIGYAAKPTVLTGLNANQSRSTLIDIVNGMEYSGVGEVNIARALGGAAEELRKSKRRSARKVIVIFGSVLSPIDDPLETATQLHEDGISIVTVVYEQSDETSLSLRLGELASPGMNFSSNTENLYDGIREAFCDINCFCLDNWMHLLSGNKKTGQCVHLMNLDADWCAGSFACQRYYDGYLMSNLDDGHMPQLLDYMINYARYPRKVIQLHVGLQYHHDVKNYVWQGGFGVLNESQPERHRWCEGYPNRDHGNVVFSVLPRTGGKQCFKNEDHYDSFFWYFCQKRACDAKNYCP